MDLFYTWYGDIGKLLDEIFPRNGRFTADQEKILDENFPRNGRFTADPEKI